ncbi:P-loop containing nucleoside triphosphate hydrolase protein [Dendrothele bispora CBS 962.96]|uniref:P-loop containing nucleoside triphosphate hydrolase protein n=1 Tax=Dendrothele bispora (strain CBS 962.96) TaxID=1314807 RepID=A0A4V4HIP9_DENBC|nr:P-loop containing nucleoside triphosphate hydrolase protein [Dendrothele bispora CBS 962.96]
MARPNSSIIDIVLPALVFFVTICHDSLSTFSTSIPKTFKHFHRTVTSPFRNFVTLQDVDLIGKPVVISRVKLRAICILGALQSAGWLGCFVYSIFGEDKISMIKSLLASIAWGYASFRTILKPPKTPPYLLILFACVHIVLALLDVVFQLRNAPVVFDVVVILAALVFLWVSGTLPLQSTPPGVNVAKPTDVPSTYLTSPEDGVDLWQWLTFSFIEPILNLAQKRTLNDEDVWKLPPFFAHKNIFKKCLDYRAQHPTHSLLRFLLVSNSLDLILDVTLELWSAFIGFVPAYSLREILSALPRGDTNTAYFWAFVTFAANLSFAQKDLFKQWHTRRCYERTRGQLFCSIHYKALKRRDVSGQVSREGEEDKNADLGKIVNLMQGDAYAVAQRFWEFSALFASPIRLVIALVFLYNVLGWSALSGVVVVLVAYVLNYPLAKYNIYITRESWKAKDTRMNTVNELLQNIRFLKFYGWEYHWGRKTNERRETELKWRVKNNVVDTLITFIWTWIPSATALISFLFYTLVQRQPLTVSTAFTAIALFSQLQEPMTALPGQFFAMLHAYVSMQRIEKFLEEEEIPDWASTLSAPVSHESSKQDKIGFSDATLEWYTSSGSQDPNAFRLGPLDFVFPAGKLSLISGPTGSGKSALLMALLGEMSCTSGSVLIDKTNHRVAYCAQNPWLEHATIRDNIIFGSSYGYDEDRYHAVIEACALVKDLEMFDAGDMTEIGEKGITLSGGQRARIALARAVYSQAQCILLDDPLAAVDMHTAQHLVNNCFSSDLVRGRTVILVTHHIGLCIPVSTYLVELHRGSVLRHGPIEGFEAKVLQEVIETEDEPFVSEDPEPTPNERQENEADALPKHSRFKSGSKANGKLIEAEARAEGRVSIHTYMTYIRAAGIFSWVLTVLLMLLIRAINILNQVFLAAWGDAYEEEYHPALVIVKKIKIKYPWDSFPSPEENVKPWLMVYLYISLAGAFSVLFYISLGYYASLQASRGLFVSLLNRLIRAPGRFFDVTPIGRILNRFTTDINTIDGALQNSARACLTGVFNFIASFLVILVIVPKFAPFALCIAWLYIRLAPPYIRASRDLRRLESISLSPAFAGFDELLRGLTHVRAFGMEERYQNTFYNKVDKFQSFDHAYWLVNTWLRWRYDCLGSVVVYATTLSALLVGVNSGLTAIVIVQAGVFAEASRQLVRVAAQLELDFNSVERVIEYLDVPQEAPAVIQDHRPPAYWPSNSGQLVVDNLVIKYAPDLPPVLRNLSFVIQPSEKIGVVGRTGSGKSTLAMSLLRMVEPTEGKIIVDGIDISTIGLEDLRTRITIVSQDVSLFSGTLRSNIDPMEENSAEECLDVMTRCHLTSVLNHKTANDEKALLDLPISQGSLSGGERQLVALARAVLRRTNIIIMDEATSQIDVQLDENASLCIQKTIREELSSAIVITIAHRLKTIVDYDRILVLDNGEIAEFGTPKELLMKSGGMFREMCRRSPDWPLFASIIDA